MALIKCKECGKQYSDTADACPHCGFVINPDYDEKYLEKCEVLYTNPNYGKTINLNEDDTILLIIGIILCGALIGIVIILYVLFKDKNTLEVRNHSAYYDKSHKKLIVFGYNKNKRYVINLNNVLYIEKEKKRLWLIYRASDGNRSICFAKYNEMYFKAFFDRMKEIKKDIMYLDSKNKNKK